MELNRDQIIKALECCTHIGTGGLVDCVCDECPYCIGKDDCRNLDAYALALINELTEEKKRLRKENDLLHSTRKNHFNRAQRNVILAIQERFTMRFGTYTDGDMTPIKEVFSLLDKFEKEMLEDAE